MNFKLYYLLSANYSWRLVAHCIYPNFCLNFSTRYWVKLSAFSVFLYQFLHTLNLNLIHAAFLLFSIHITCWYENSLRCCFHSRGIALRRYHVLWIPVIWNKYNFVLFTLIVQRKSSFKSGAPNWNLLRSSLTKIYN